MLSVHSIDYAFLSQDTCEVFISPSALLHMFHHVDIIYILILTHLDLCSTHVQHFSAIPDTVLLVLKLSHGPGKAAGTSTALILESSGVLHSQCS